MKATAESPKIVVAAYGPAASRRLSAPSTPEGEAELVAWLRANRVGRGGDGGERRL